MLVLKSEKRYSCHFLKSKKAKRILFKNWNGAVATIIPDPDNRVIGCLWSIEKSHQRRLDRQEGVHRKIYEPIEES